MDGVKDFLEDYNNRTKVRYIGFSAAFVVMLVGIAAAIVAGILANGILAGVAAFAILAGFVTLPVTDLNYPRSRRW